MSRGVKYEKDEKICKDILRIVKPLGSIVNPRIVIKPHKKQKSLVLHQNKTKNILKQNRA